MPPRGSSITMAPMNPTITAAQRRMPTGSPNNGTDRAVMKIGKVKEQRKGGAQIDILQPGEEHEPGAYIDHRPDGHQQGPVHTQAKRFAGYPIANRAVAKAKQAAQKQDLQNDQLSTEPFNAGVLKNKQERCGNGANDTDECCIAPRAGHFRFQMRFHSHHARRLNKGARLCLNDHGYQR